MEKGKRVIVMGELVVQWNCVISEFLVHDIFTHIIRTIARPSTRPPRTDASPAKITLVKRNMSGGGEKSEIGYLLLINIEL